MKKITVVIPAFNAHSSIEKTLSSISNQVNVEEVLTVIVNDKSEKNYDDIVKKFKKVMDIDVINLEENGGPGVARNEGLKACLTPYITFIDADDVLLDNLFFKASMQILDSKLNCTNINVAFFEELQNKSYQPHLTDVTWMFGKIYRVDYLKENNITFSNARANEDLEFNLKVAVSHKDNEHTEFINDRFSYLWKYNENSITRKNEKEYTYYEGQISGIQAKISAYKFSNKNYESLRRFISLDIFEMYYNYNLILIEKPEKKDWQKKVLSSFKKYYNNFLIDLFKSFTYDDKVNLFKTYVLESTIQIIPIITFDHFIELLEAEYETI